MGGEGSMKAMSDSLKANRNLRRKKSFFSKENAYQNRKIEYLRAAKGVANIKTASKEELALIRKKYTWQRRKKYLFISIFFTLSFILFSYFSFQTIQNSKKKDSQIEKKILVEKITKTSFFISDGDKQLEKGHWHNAIFQYKKALEILPNDYDLQYRLTYAYVYQCRNTKKDCAIANEKVSKLLAIFPEKKDLIALQNVLSKLD
jgi:hypothetical protein